MLFMYIHTHSSDRCMAEKPQELARLLSSVLENCAKANIKLIGSYVAAHEHTSYTILETDDMLKLQTALVPMTLWGMRV